MKKKRTAVMDISKILQEVLIPQLEQLLDQSSHQIKEGLKNAQSAGLSTPEQLFEVKKAELKEGIQAICKEMKRVDRAIDTFNRYRGGFLTQEESLQLEKELDNFFERFPHNPPENIKDKTFQEMLGLSLFILYCFYQVGHQLCQEKLYAEAADVFMFLTILNPKIKDHWIGLGISERELHHLDWALHAFSVAAWLDATDPEPHLFAADCHVRNGEYEMAKKELMAAKELVHQKPALSKWQPVIDLLQQKIYQP